MNKNIRENFGNWGGVLHLLGNISLACKVFLDQVFAGQSLHWANGAAGAGTTFSGLLFISGSLVLAVAGHKNKSYVLAGCLAMSGYFLLGLETISGTGAAETVSGLAIGFLAAFYGVIQALRREPVQYKLVTFLLVPGETLSRVLHKRLLSKNSNLNLFERFPFLSSGLIEFTSDAAIVIGACRTGDYSLAFIALCWTLGSMLLMSALPRVTRYKP